MTTIRKQKGPVSVAADPSQNQKTLSANDTPTKIPRKWQRVLRSFLTGRSFNRFEAERQLHDHALHSTVSDLQRRGIVIDRRLEVVPGYQDSPTHVCRYWMNHASFGAARGLLGIQEGNDE